MNLQRQLLAAQIGGLFWDQTTDGGQPGGGGAAAATQTTQVTPADARQYLSEFGHSPDALKGMQDADVVKLHQTVSANYSKRMTAEQKAAAERAKEAAKGIKLEAPKDSKLSQDDVERIAARARERGLTPEQAKAELDYENSVLTGFEKRAVEAFNQQQAERKSKWQEAIKKDPDLGGDNVQRTEKHVQLARDTFMGENVHADMKELRALLDHSGLGSHPGMVRMLATIGAALAEDDGGPQGGAAAGGGGKKSAINTLYGESTPE